MMWICPHATPECNKTADSDPKHTPQTFQTHKHTPHTLTENPRNQTEDDRGCDEGPVPGVVPGDRGHTQEDEDLAHVN